MKLAMVAACALALTGCAAQQKAEQLPPVNVTSDSYCKIAKRRTWSVNDTSETIDEARRENAKFDRICGGAKAVS